MIQVICIKWGDKFSAEYVNKLFRGIKRNTTKEFLFTCYTDNSEGLLENISSKAIPLSTGDWYSKISLYNKELYTSTDQIFYFDLDTVIVGNLDEILSYRGEFIILRDFYKLQGFGSGLMSWQPDAANHMWTTHTKGMKYKRGDQGWPELAFPHANIWQAEYPEKVISYKVHIRDNNVIPPRQINRRTNLPGSLETASIVCFHGKPLPHEITENWMKEHWI